MSDTILRTTPVRDDGLSAALVAAGGVSSLARMLGLSHVSVSRWRRVPPHRVLEIERLLKGSVTRNEMRPDLYPDERPS